MDLKLTLYIQNTGDFFMGEKGQKVQYQQEAIMTGAKDEWVEKRWFTNRAFTQVLMVWVLCQAKRVGWLFWSKPLLLFILKV